MFTTKKIAIVSVINDLVTDNRVKKTCFTLLDCKFDVVLIGRQLPNSLQLPDWPYKSIRMRFLFNKGPLFYVFFNIRLFFHLLVRPADLLYSNDLDTLLPNYLISRIKRIPLIYDSHELFCEVPELINSPFKRKVWLFLEKKIIPQLKHCITVNQSIASIFEKKYNTPFHIIRNIPDTPSHFKLKSRQELGLPINKKIVLLQGAGINMDRGAEELLDAMTTVNNALLLIIGGGDVWEYLKSKISASGISEKVRLIEKMPKAELLHYTFNADLGLSIDKNTNLNYYYSLPNKVFDYIHAGVPILASRLPEIENLINEYQIGGFIENHSPTHISETLNKLLTSPVLVEFAHNTLKAKSELVWTKEKEKLQDIIIRATQ